MTEHSQAIVSQVTRIVTASLDAANGSPSAMKLVGHEWAALLRLLTEKEA